MTNLQGSTRRQLFQQASKLGDAKFGGEIGLGKEESPWERKRRMERKIRLRDSRMRAQGIPLNSEFAR